MIYFIFVARLANHACSVNCNSRLASWYDHDNNPRVVLMSVTDIKKGDQILYKYNDNFADWGKVNSITFM